MTATTPTRTRRTSSEPSLQKASRSRTRATAKTGDPQADRAARDAATKAITKPSTPEQQAASAAAVPAKLSKRDAKRDLARRVMLAVDEVVRTLDDSDAAMALGRDEAARTAAQWLHHLPVGADWFAESISTLPKPDRSDWR